MNKPFTDILGIENNVYVKNKKYKEAVPLVETSTNAFINAQSNVATTENGASVNISTLSPLADWFFHSAAMRREKDENRILNLFRLAFNEDPTSALRVLFYTRDVRGGQGERRVFRICLKYLGDVETKWLGANLNLIAEYGRFDDYLILLETPLKDEVVEYLGIQLQKDLEHCVKEEVTSISLLAKWLPSENASSAVTKKYAKLLLETGRFGSAKAYRKALSMLRKSLDLVETKLTNGEFDKIDYSKLPSYAGLKYRKAFSTKDGKRYCQFLEDVANEKEVNGKKVTINANTLYPYDIVGKYLNGGNFYSGHTLLRTKVDNTLEEQWKALPKTDLPLNGLVVCDTSGSMGGFPITVSMSLALYIAENNSSKVWKDYVIPFSNRATWQHIKGDTLLERLSSLYTGDCSNTNLEAVFNLILDKAVAKNVPAADMPETLIIVSDMEFDSFKKHDDVMNAIRNKYKKAGYTLPTLVWWNVESRSNKTPVTIDDQNNIVLGGANPAVLKTALTGKAAILDVVYNVINTTRYEKIMY